MNTIFQTIKGVFFLASIFIGLFFLRGSYIIKDQNIFLGLVKVVMPGYLIITGILLGLLLSNFVVLKNEYNNQEKIQKVMIKGLIFGIVIGLILSLFYILFS